MKAYEVNDGEHVYLTDEDFQAAEEERYRTIEILDFVPRDEIDPIVFHRTYYLGPADGAEKVYALLLKAMESSELSAIARYVFHDRQQLGALRIRDGVITLENMYFADEIRPTKGIVPKKLPRVDKRELEMAGDARRAVHVVVRPRALQGRVPQAKLLKIVKQKQKGEEVHIEPQEEREAPADMLEALRASVEAARSGSATQRPSQEEGGAQAQAARKERKPDRELARGVRLELGERDELERGGVRRLEDDGRSDARLERLLPARRDDAPAVAGPQAGEHPLRLRRDEVVPGRDRELEELLGHHRADDVEAEVRAGRVAVAVTEVARDRVDRARLELAAEDVHVGELTPSR